MDEPTIRFGYPAEWERFKTRHGLFLEKHRDLLQLVSAVFDRSWLSREAIDRVVFLLGRTCLEDFSELVLLCGNGYGIGASKLLRGMFERALTTRHLHDHPEAVDAFLDFYWISEMKRTRALDRNIGKDWIPDDARMRIEEEYARVKPTFVGAPCTTCGARQTGHSWTTLDLVSMAEQYPLYRQLLVPAYTVPTQQIHSSAANFLVRGTANSEGIEFDGGPKKQEADVALFCAHHILIDVLELQIEHFSLDTLNAQLEACRTDASHVWEAHEFRRQAQA